MYGAGSQFTAYVLHIQSTAACLDVIHLGAGG